MTKFLRSVLSLFLTFLLCAFCLVSCSGQKEPYETEIVSVKLDNKGENIKIEATFDSEFVNEHKGEKVYLLVLNTPYTGRLGGTQSPAAQTKVKDKVDFEIPLYENNSTRIASSFVLALYSEATESDPASYVPVTGEAYINNPEKTAVNTSEVEHSASVKGITDYDIERSVYLGVSHMLIEVRIDKILSEEYREGAYCHNHNGVTYFFDREEVSLLDEKIKTATDNGIEVYLQFILGMPNKDEDGNFEYEMIDCLYCPDADSDKSGYMINMTNTEAVGYVRALFDFFASRYSVKDGEYGFAANFVIGKNANGYSEYNNAGSWDAELYQTCYSVLVRTAHNILRSYCQNGEVYLSVSNIWRNDTGYGNEIGAKAFLNKLLSNGISGGNFDWNVSLSLNSASDALWTDSAEAYPNITVNSIHELTNLLSSGEYLYGEESRKLIVDELKLTGNTQDSASLQRMSASYAYAYYKLSSDGKVTAVFYDCASSSVTDPGGEGLFGEVFRYCGTDNADALGSLSTIVGSMWDEISIAVNSDESCLLTEKSAVTSLDRSKLRAKKSLYDFSLGSDYGFFASGGMEYAALVNKSFTDGSQSTALSAVPSSGEGADGEWAAIKKTDLKASEIKASGYLGITLSSDKPRQVMIIISDSGMRDGKRAVFAGTGSAGAQVGTVYFDISDFVSEISSSDNLTFSICVDGGDPAALTIYDISLYGSSGSGAGSVVTVVVVVVLAAGGAAALLYFVMKRKKSDGEE